MKKIFNHRVKFLSLRHEITTLRQEGYLGKDIYKIVGLDGDMSYATFMRYLSHFIKAKKIKRTQNRKGHARVKFLAALEDIKRLSAQGYCAKEIQSRVHLNKNISYPSFAQYFAFYVKKKPNKRHLLTLDALKTKEQSKSPQYDPHHTRRRVQSWAPPDPWPDM